VKPEGTRVSIENADGDARGRRRRDDANRPDAWASLSITVC